MFARLAPRFMLLVQFALSAAERLVLPVQGKAEADTNTTSDMLTCLLGPSGMTDPPPPQGMGALLPRHCVTNACLNPSS